MMKRRIVSLVLALCMLTSLFPALTTAAGAAEGQGGSAADLLNLDKNKPAGLETAVDPYGYGKEKPFLLIEQNELLLYQSKNRSENKDNLSELKWYDTYKPARASANFNGNEVFADSAQLTAGMTDYTFFMVQGVAFDPNGSGRKDHVAYVGVENTPDNQYRKNIAYLWVVDSQTGKTSKYRELGRMNWALEDKDQFYQYMNGQQFLSVTAGDYDGDGKETLVVYAALDRQENQRSENSNGCKIVEYQFIDKDNDFSNAHSYNKGLLHDLYVEEDAEINGAFAGKGTGDDQNGRVENKLGVSMATGDFNADGKDDLAVVSYISRASDKAENLPYGFYIPQLRVSYGGSGTILKTPSVRASLSIENMKNDNTVENYSIPVAPTVSAGRINSSDVFDDLIIAGLKGTVELKGGNDAGKANGSYSTDVSKYHILTFNGGGGKALEAAVNRIDKTANGWTFHGEYSSDRVNSPVITACVATNGGGAQNDVFINGDLYKVTDKDLTRVYESDYFSEKDDGASGWGITSTFIQSAAVGNFDGNDAGREQIALTIGLKRSSDVFFKHDYRFMTGIIGGKDYDDTDNSLGTARSYYSYVDSDNYFTTETHPKKGVNYVLVAVDRDNDGQLARYNKDVGYAYSDPEVLAVLQAAPYFSELQDDSADNETGYAITTSYEMEQSTSDSVSFSVGAVFEGEFNIGVVKTKLSIEAGYALDWSQTFTHAVSKTYSQGFTAGAYDTVVVCRTPVLFHTYDMQQKDGSWGEKALTISVPQEPVYVQLSVDEYNRFADAYNKQELKKRDEKNRPTNALAPTLNFIDEKENYLLNNEGNPYMYFGGGGNNDGKIDTFKNINKTPIQLGYNGAMTSIDWEEEESAGQAVEMSHGFYFNYAMTFGTDAAAGGFSTGLEYSRGRGTSKTTSTAYGRNCTVQDIDGPGLAAQGVPESVYTSYGFSWQLIQWARNMGGNSSKTVPFLGFNITGLKSPPLAPKELEASAAGLGDDSTVTLTWDTPASPGWPAPTGYNVYRIEANRFDISYVKLNDSPVDVTTYTVEGLESNTEYSFVVTSLNGNVESIYSNEAKAITPKQNFTVSYAVDDPAAADVQVTHLGNVSINSGDTISEASVVNLTATAKNPGYQITGLTLQVGERESIIPADDNGAAQMQYGFLLAGNTEITVNTKKLVAESTVTYVAESENGAVTAKVGGVNFTSGGEATGPVIFTAVAEEGYALKEWKVTDGDDQPQTIDAAGLNPYTLYLTAATHRVEPVFVPASQVGKTVKITLPDEGGTVKLTDASSGEVLQLNEASSVTVPLNSQITFTAVPDAGCTFRKWTGAATAQTEAEFTMQITEAVTVGVEFDIPVRYALTCSAEGSGTVSSDPVPKNGMLPATTPVTLTAVANENYRVEKRVITAGGKEETITRDDQLYIKDSHSLTLSAGTYVEVYFKQIEQYSVTVTPIGNGTVTVYNDTTGKAVTLGENAVKFRDDLTVTVQPDPGWKLADTTGWTTKADGSYTRSITGVKANQTIPVTFQDITQYNVTVNKTGNGTVTVRKTDEQYPSGTEINESGTVKLGGRLDIKVEPDEGWQLDPMQAAANSALTIAGGSYTISNIAAPQALSFTFVEKPVLTISRPENGTVTVTGTQGGTSATITNGDRIDYDTNVTVALAPAMGYVVNEPDPGWTAAENSDNYSYTLNNVQSVALSINHSFTALTTYRVSYGVVDTNGEAYAGGHSGTLRASVTRKSMSIYQDIDGEGKISGEKQVYAGSAVTFTAAPEGNYRVSQWTVNGTVQPDHTGNTLTLDAGSITQDTAISVLFEMAIHKVSFTQPANGTLSATTAGNPINSGASVSGEVTFTVEPEANYEVYQWLVDGKLVEGQTGNTYTFTPTATSTAVRVQLRGVALSVTATAGAGGTVSGLPEPVRYGETVTLSAQADTGFAFAGWYRNNRLTEGDTDRPDQLTFTAQTAAAYEARFTPGRYAVTYSANEGGRLSATVSNGSTVAAGTVVTFTARPADGYRLASWSSNVSPSETNPLVATATVSDALDVSVTFEAIPVYDIDIAELENGAITATVNGQEVTQVPEGTEVTFTAIPAPNYMLGGWTGDAVDQTGAVITLIANGDLAVGATFKGAVYYTVTCIAEGDGTVTGSVPGQQFPQGSPVQLVGGSMPEFTATPGSSRMVSGWTVSLNDVAVPQENITTRLRAEALAGDLTVTVHFKEYVGYDIPTSQKGYTIDNVVRTPDDTTPETQIREGGTVTFTILPVTGENVTAAFTQLLICDNDFIDGGQADNIQVVKNEGGSYTVTITEVAREIIVELGAHKVKAEALANVPAGLEEIDALDTVEKIEAALQSELGGNTDAHTILDVTLQIWDSATSEWTDATADNFPADGVEVLIPYPPNTTRRDSFTILHMLTAAHDGRQPGDIETIRDVSRDADGLRFRVHSLSPFAIGWNKYVPSGGGGGGGSIGGLPTTYEPDVTQPDEGGTVSVTPASPEQGDKVTITTKPEAGYAVEQILVTDKNGKPVEITDHGDGTFSFTQPTGKVKIEATFKRTETVWINPFTDVDPNAWYYDSVAYAVESGLFFGTADTAFSPNATMTRAMLMTVLARMDGQDTTAPAGGTWYDAGMNWAMAQGISDGTAPDGNITREQLATMLHRYAQYKDTDVSVGENTNILSYADIDEAGEWAIPALQWACGAGVLNGKGGGVLDPKGNATRAEVATMLQRFLSLAQS